MKNNLEKLIKQTIPFKTEVQKAEVGFLYLSYCFTNLSKFRFQKYGITGQQYNILRILKGQHPKPANINLLKDRMLDKMSDASRLVDRLILQELVIKESNAKDKRNVDVFITQKALRLLEKINTELEYSESPFSKISKDDLTRLNLIIDNLLEFI